MGGGLSISVGVARGSIVTARSSGTSLPAAQPSILPNACPPIPPQEQLQEQGLVLQLDLQ